MANMNQKSGAIKARNPVSGGAMPSFATQEVTEGVVWIEEDRYDCMKSFPTQMTGSLEDLPLKPYNPPPPREGFGPPDPENLVKVKDIRIESNLNRVNGIVVTGGMKEWEFDGARIELSGYGCSDFTSRGAGALVTESGNLTLRNADIDVSGGGRCATIATQHGTLRVYDSRLSARGGELPPNYSPVIGPGMMEPPWPLGLSGNARTHLTMDNSRTFFYNCDIYAAGWGAISTDASGGCTYFEANDCRITVEGNGYGTYADNGCHNYFNRCKFKVGNMLAIQDGNSSITLTDTDADCARNAFMLHGGCPDWVDTGIIEVHGGHIKAKEAVFLAKSTNVDIYVEGAVLESESGVLVRAMETDDEIYHMRRAYGEDCYGVQVTFDKMEARGDLLREDMERRVIFSLADTALTGAVKGYPTLEMYGAARWFAAADSEVVLGSSVDLQAIDAARGVKIRARRGENAVLPGEYGLPGGGTLVIE